MSKLHLEDCIEKSIKEKNICDNLTNILKDDNNINNSTQLHLQKTLQLLI